TVVAPKGRWQNLSSQTADFFAYCGLTNPQGIREYSQSFQVIGLAPGEDTVISFPGHSVGNNVGRWSVCCSTVAVRDTYPANDGLRREFAVYAGGGLVRGWHELKP
ncbi:MAG: hypothetical protein ABIK44_07330, partial [candidate division WOR-3 bacterium]